MRWISIELAVIVVWWEYCLASHVCRGVEEPTLHHRLATKTGYFSSEKNTRHWNQFNKEVDGCAASQVWLLNRHGTRYPTENDMDKMMALLPDISQKIIANHQQGRGCLKEKELDQFQDWFPPYSPRDKDQLQETGHDELAAIGEYWRSLFPHIFSGRFDPAKFKVDFTVKNRTGQSAYHFLRGMFGEDEVGNIELPQPFSPNFILRFYKACPRWLREVYKNNETTYKEQQLFMLTQDFQNVAHMVSARLGFMHPLRPDELEAVYNECRFETAWWLHRSSAWCAPFSHHDFEVMEYNEDLKYYYEDSFGHPLNMKTACRTLSDIYLHFRSTINTGEARPQGIMYFAHDKTIMKVLASLGMFRPHEHLRHNNFHRMRERVWRTSFVAPFGTNLALVLYRCSEGEHMEHKVGVFFQGHPTPLREMCVGVACQWEELHPWFAEKHTTCDLNKLCMLHDEL